MPTPILAGKGKRRFEKGARRPAISFSSFFHHNLSWGKMSEVRALECSVINPLGEKANEDDDIKRSAFGDEPG